MGNWRHDIKTLFANGVANAIPGVNKFGAHNSQKENFDDTETAPPLAVYFEYSNIGDGFEYLLQRDGQQADRVPVAVTLHIIFSSYNDTTQDLAYDYAEALTFQFSGIKDDIISGRIEKISEIEDINHRAQYEYKITFAFSIKEAVAKDTLLEDGNPVDAGGNPETGRKLYLDISGQIVEGT